jgi:predicted anti-sigma-YlaC factor YlaD
MPPPMKNNGKNNESTMKRAMGSFEVSLQPLPNNDVSTESNLGRMLLTKKFSGDLAASARGQMLSAVTTIKGSAGYVAIDHVTGELDGRRGSFILQHSGAMNRGVPSLSIMVVPDSGTDELLGLSGTLSINVIDGKHFYDFIYSIPHRAISEQERLKATA